MSILPQTPLPSGCRLTLHRVCCGAWRRSLLVMRFNSKAVSTVSLPPLLCAPLCPALCDPVGCSPPGSSVHGILQARRLEWVAICYFKGSSRHRDQTYVSLASPALALMVIPFKYSKAEVAVSLHELKEEPSKRPRQLQGACEKKPVMGFSSDLLWPAELGFQETDPSICILF